MKKILFFLMLSTAVLASSSTQVGGGFRGQFVVVNDLEPGFGAGVHLLVGQYPFFFYPNMDFWFAGHPYNYRVWNHDHWNYYTSPDYHVYEIAFNLDVKFAFPVRPVSPYMGFGVCPVVTGYEGGYHDSYTNFGFNAFGGIGFRLNSSSSCFFEFRGKMGNDYNVFKMSFGMTFYGS